MLDGVGVNQCLTDEDCTHRPYVEDMRVLPESYCIGLPGCGEVSLQWIYQDDDGDPEIRFDFQADDNSDFSSPEINRSYSGLLNSVGTINTQSIMVKIADTYPSCDYINYGTSYYWRVMVWDSTELDSGWVEYDNPADPDEDGNSKTYTKDLHAHPNAEFNSLPAGPVPEEEVTFPDLSICYDRNHNSYACKDINPNTDAYNSYTWQFGDESGNHVIGNTSHTYELAGIYTVRLEVCDDIGCCDTERDIQVGVGVPGSWGWREIPPF